MEAKKTLTRTDIMRELIATNQKLKVATAILQKEHIRIPFNMTEAILKIDKIVRLI